MHWNLEYWGRVSWWGVEGFGGFGEGRRRTYRTKAPAAKNVMPMILTIQWIEAVAVQPNLFLKFVNILCPILVASPQRRGKVGPSKRTIWDYDQ